MFIGSIVFTYEIPYKKFMNLGYIYDYRTNCVIDKDFGIVRPPQSMIALVVLAR